MKRFAHLLDRLVLTPSRNGKLRLMVDYFLSTPDPERGYALAAITRDLNLASVKPAALRGLVVERMDEELFRLSYDYVGDLAETIALVWDADRRTSSRGSRSHTEAGFVNDEIANPEPSLTDVVETLNRMGKSEALLQVSRWLDVLDASGRYALVKLITGGLRIGVSARLAKVALAEFGARHIDIDIIEIEELWHGLEIPYTDLFAWLSGTAGKPTHRANAPFRP
ncbi:MAG: ATP-dependent DNA ligase, partial [Pseudomonadota bacterium]